jgi:hypothetical protein
MWDDLVARFYGAARADARAFERLMSRGHQPNVSDLGKQIDDPSSCCSLRGQLDYPYRGWR